MAASRRFFPPLIVSPFLFSSFTLPPLVISPLFLSRFPSPGCRRFLPRCRFPLSPSSSRRSPLLSFPPPCLAPLLRSYPSSLSISGSNRSPSPSLSFLAFLSFALLLSIHVVRLVVLVVLVIRWSSSSFAFVVQALPLSEVTPPTSLWRGEGRVLLWSVLRILGRWWLSPHPSEEGRGSWPGCGAWSGGNGGVEEEGGGGGMNQHRP
jgi:hypothetical protein